jgi:hypothetical protein
LDGDVGADADLVATVRSVLADAGNPAIAVGQQAYMKSAMPYRGVPSPVLKRVRFRGLSRREALRRLSP